LVAHNRNATSIAAHIGADSVVYQSLSDLKRACAELSPRDPLTQEFEVGVFCGKYVTPVSAGYFEHLERVRGESQKTKVVESAKEAVAHGTAGEKELRIAAKGLELDAHGNLIPAGDLSPKLNGASSTEETKPVRDQMDISLHNFGDYPHM
jgi:amidophosphoribosyltransferase